MKEAKEEEWWEGVKRTTTKEHFTGRGGDDYGD